MALVLAADEREKIEAATRPAKAEQRVVRRAQAVLMMADAVPAADIARLLGVHPRTVEEWRRRFNCATPSERRVDAPRSGRPPSLSRSRRGASRTSACITHWSASLLGEHVRSQGIAISDRSVSRILRDADLQPHRQQMYLTSHDNEFREKRDDVLRVYYERQRTSTSCASTRRPASSARDPDLDGR